MKNIIFAILFFGATQAQAQQQQLRYIEYADSVREFNKETKLVAATVKMWFNDSLSYQQNWAPLPVVSIKPTEGRITAKVKITQIEYKKRFAADFYAQKVNVCKIINGNNLSRIFLNYDIIPGETVAYVSPNVPKDSITYINNQRKTILGYTCKLALFHVKNEIGQPEAVKVWYTEDIKLNFGPERYAQQLPGMVLKVESTLHNFTAIKLETPTATAFNFEAESKKTEQYSYQAVKLMFEKRYQDYLKNK